MKIKKLSSFERKFVLRLRELTEGMSFKDLSCWNQRALDNFEKHRPHTLDEKKDIRYQELLNEAMSLYQCTGREFALAVKEGRSPRPDWETNPENFEPDPESNIPF